MHNFVSSWFALVTADDETEFILLKEGGCDVRSEVCARATQGIRHAASSALRVWPQNVEYLYRQINYKYIEYL